MRRVNRDGPIPAGSAKCGNIHSPLPNDRNAPLKVPSGTSAGREIADCQGPSAKHATRPDTPEGEKEIFGHQSNHPPVIAHDRGAPRSVDRKIKQT